MEFLSVDELERSLTEAGLRDRAADILASARPGITFLRRPTPDDPLPPGTSKHGGFPDLPPGAAWPTGGVHPDAARLAREIQTHHDEFVLDARKSASKHAGDEPWYLTKAGLAQLTARHQDEQAALFREFPLAFALQLDLNTLSAEPGFDSMLPRHGLLSVFLDLRDQRPKDACVLWHNEPLDVLVRQSPPNALVTRFDLEHTYPGSDRYAWIHETEAETLNPISIITVDNAWSTTRPYEDSAALLDWRHDTITDAYDEIRRTHVKKSSDYVGGRFCGWPYLYQSDPGADLPGGRNAWRHICSWGGEYGQGRVMPSIAVGTGIHYIMMRPADIAARRFSEARLVIAHE